VIIGGGVDKEGKIQIPPRTKSVTNFVARPRALKAKERHLIGEAA